MIVPKQPQTLRTGVRYTSFVEMGNGRYEILTKYDLLHAIAHLVESRRPQ